MRLNPFFRFLKLLSAVSLCYVCLELKAQVNPSTTKQAVGEIEGKVLDENGDGMPGASVQDQGSGNGALTNVDGTFRISSVPLGTRTLIISFIGYQKVSIDVKVQQGIVPSVNVKLQPADQTLGEVVIQAKADVRYSPIMNSTDLQLVNVMKLSEGVVVGISNEQIAKSSDRDASQIAQRISGVSLVDKFVVVRGMDPRYNLTLVNGTVAPSSEDESRAFSYDALPTGVIDRIELEKAPGPHLPAMWGGGVVKIFTRNFTSSRQFNFDFSGAYRTGGSSFTNNFWSYEGSNKDWYANGAGDRRLPELLTRPYFLYPDFKTYPVENVAIARSGNLRTFTPKRTRHDFDKRVNFSYYDSWKLGGMKLNNLTSVSYTQERFFRQVYRSFAGGLYTELPPTIFPAVDTVLNEEGKPYYRNVPEQMSTDSLYEEQIRISAVQSLGLLLNDDNDISATVFYNRFGTDQFVQRDGVSDLSGDPDEIFKNYVYSYRVRDILVGQLGGSHKFGNNGIEWTLGTSRTKNAMPDRQSYRFVRNTRLDPENYWTIYYGDDLTRVRYQSHFVYETEEKSLTGRIDYRKDFTSQFFVRAGVFYDRKDRNFFSNLYNILNIAVDGNVSNPTGRGRDIENKLTEPWNKVDSVYAAENFNTNKLFMEAEVEPINYFFDDESREAYLALGFPIFSSLSFYGGARVANLRRVLYDFLDRPVDSARFRGEWISFPDRNVTYVLPSAMLKLTLAEGKYIVRGVYGESVDRPQYREQSNLLIYDPVENSDLQGVPGIFNSRIHHADLRAEFYPNPSEVVTIGGFYKYIDKPISRFTYAFNVPQVQYYNIDYARLFGIELEVRKKFDFIKLPVLRKMSVNLNASYTWTEAVQTDEVRSPGVPLVRRLQGTSPYLLNASAYYENTDKGTLVSVLYNLTWDRIRDYAATDGLGNLVEARRGQVDVVIKQRLTKFLSLKAGVQNLFDQRVRLYRDADESYSYDASPSKIVFDSSQSGFGDYIEQEYRPGAYYSIGFNFNF